MAINWKSSIRYKMVHYSMKNYRCLTSVSKRSVLTVDLLVLSIIPCTFLIHCVKAWNYEPHFNAIKPPLGNRESPIYRLYVRFSHLLL